MKNKLSRVKTKLTSPQEETDKLSLVKKMKTYPRSYRWREYDLQAIDDLIAKASIGSYKVDATKLIRGALYLANKKSSEKLLDAILDAERKSLTSRVK